MIALEDITAMCELTAEEVAAIAEHEHIPELSAAALGAYLLHQARGAEVIRAMMRDDIRAAIRQGDGLHARQLIAALNHFLLDHPEAMRR
jgi:S-ribosylhomocysteine lyase LuxS involved in autoinducer biosynthesis